MKYLEVIFNLTCQNDVCQISKDLLMDLAGSAGFESFDDETDALRGYVPQNLFDPEALNRELGVFPIPGVKIDYEIKEVEDVNWNQTWEANGFDPIEVDDRLMIYDAKHMTADQLSSGHDCLLIGIDAVQAFGSGSHQTTRMMLAALLQLDLRGKNVLDCGCGTGILSIGASLLGAEKVVAFDIDEWSVANARHNAGLNGIGNMRILHGDASVIPADEGPFDIVMANINRNILLADIPAYLEVMTAGSLLLVSGFLMEDVTLLTAQAAKWNLEKIGQQSENEWCQLTFRKMK